MGQKRFVPGKIIENNEQNNIFFENIGVWKLPQNNKKMTSFQK